MKNIMTNLHIGHNFDCPKSDIRNVDASDDRWLLCVRHHTALLKAARRVLAKVHFALLLLPLS